MILIRLREILLPELRAPCAACTATEEGASHKPGGGQQPGPLPAVLHGQRIPEVWPGEVADSYPRDHKETSTAPERIWAELAEDKRTQTRCVEKRKHRLLPRLFSCHRSIRIHRSGHLPLLELGHYGAALLPDDAGQLHVRLRLLPDHEDGARP